MKYSSTLLFCMVYSFIALAQDQNERMYPYTKESNFFMAREKAEKFFKEQEEEKKLSGFHREDADEIFEEQEEYAQFKRWENFWQNRVLPDGSYPSSSFLLQEVARKNELTQSSSSPFYGNWACISQTTCTGGYNGMGRTTCTAFDPVDPDIFYVGAPNGGIWKTTDGGLSYVSLGDQLPFVSAGSIAVDPVSPNTLYVSTGDAVGWWNYGMGVYKSTDGGQSWSPTSLSWQLSGQIAIYKIMINPANPNILYAATTNGLFRTVNAGGNWTKVINSSVADMELKPGDPSVVYAVTDDYWGSSELFVSPDSGATWNQTSSFATASNALKLAVTPADPNFLAVFATNNMSLYVSTTSGTNLSLRQTNLPGFAAVFVSPQSANIMYCGAIVVQKSNDGGMTWQQITDWYNSGSYPEVHADLHNINWNPLRPLDLYFNNDGGLYRYEQNASSWTELSDNLVITQFYSLATSQSDPYFLTGGTQDNGGRKRVAQSLWASTNGGDAMVTAIDENNDNIIYTTYTNGQLYRSRDKWTNDQYHDITPLDNLGNRVSGSWVTPYVLNPQNNNSIYAGYDGMYYSSNQGDSWTKLNLVILSGGTINSMEVAPSDSNYMYVGQENVFYYSFDHGQTWNHNPFSGSETISSIAVDPTNPLHVWITRSGYGNHVYKSTDGGVNFQNITGALPNVPANAIFYEPNSPNGIYVGTDIGIFYTNDSIGSWISFNDGLPAVQVTDFALYRATNKLRVSTYGRGIWESDLYSVMTNIPVTGSKASFTIYPNPGHGTFEFSYMSGNAGAGKLRIFSMEGKELSNFSLPSGSNKITIPEGTLSAGAYVCKVDFVNGETLSEKLIVLQN
ncbi:MAG TPA: T9SS type A sorting domain-containing protein [Bacteroidia bacterium]|nr:T9SS type A sorting domain-containing protein [Bacteroidia bacterium]